MKLEIDSTAKPAELRAAAAFCLMLAGDIRTPMLDAPDDLENAAHTHGELTPHRDANVVPFVPPVSTASGPVPGTGFPPAPPAPRTLAEALQREANAVPAVTTFAPNAANVASVIPANQSSSPGTVQPMPDPRDNPFRGHTNADAAVPAFSPNGIISPNTAVVPPVSAQWPATSAQLPPNLLPPPNFSMTSTTTAPLPPAPAATTSSALVAPAAAPGNATAVEYDKAGLPWDARIHNKGRTKKKDGTWKLQKGLDPIFAQTVVAELAARKLAPGAVAAPPTFPVPAAPASVPQNQPSNLPPMSAGAPQASGYPAPFVMPPPLGQGPLTPDPTAEARAAFAGAPPLPAGQQLPPFGSFPAPLNTVPLPPVQPYQYPVNGAPAGALPLPPFPGSTGPAMVPPPPVAAPVPPAPQPGPAGGVSPPASGYKQLIDKLTMATQNKTLNPALAAPTVQRFGVPNMGMLGDPAYAGLLPAINQEFDRLIAGGAPSGP